MFPLKSRKLIRGYQAHIKAGLGGGADYVASYVALYAPFAGKIETFYGKEGGNWIRLIRSNGDKLEFAHLSKYIIKTGVVAAGKQIAVTGNTGQITTGPHLHIQIFRNGRRIDPDTYDWGTTINNKKMKLVKDNGTVYIVTGNKDVRKIGIADEIALGLFGDEPQEEMDTSKIPQFNTIASNGIVISSN